MNKKKKKQEAILFSSVISGILIASSLLSISSQLIQEVRAQNMTNQPRTNATANQTDMDNATTTIISPLSPSCCPSNGYIANAGPDQTVLEGTIITLNGSSYNNNNNSSNVGDTANYLWRQTEGPAVILNDNNTAHPTFVAPNYPNDTKYAFALEVSENQDVNNNNNNQTGSEIDTLEIISKDVNMKTKNPGSLQEADNIEDQSSQDELQDEGTTGNDG
jgi:hypothetical protein